MGSRVKNGIENHVSMSNFNDCLLRFRILRRFGALSCSGIDSGFSTIISHFTECFSINSFEQFCINYSNEKFQKFSNDVILKDEQEIYRLVFTDNGDIIELLESNLNGIVAILNDETKSPNPSSENFTRKGDKHRNVQRAVLLSNILLTQFNIQRYGILFEKTQN